MELLKKVRNKYFKWSQTKSLGPGDVLLASYPKCGNTFCRFVFSNILVELFNLEERVNFQTIEYLTPSLGTEYLNRPWRFEGYPRVIKTHDEFRREFSSPAAVIYVMRDPRDMLISYHKWMQAHKRVQYQGDLDSFARHREYGIQGYIQHIESWNEGWDHLFRYEDLMERGESLFGEFFDDWKGVEVTQGVIRRSVLSSLPENVKRIEESAGNKIREKILDSGFRHVRSGKTGQWQSVMKEDTLDYLEEFSDFFRHYGYDLALG